MLTDQQLTPFSSTGTEDRSRYVLFPIKYPALWQAYKLAQSSFWTAEEIELSRDRQQWRDVLTGPERHFLSFILGFFAAADGIVAENLAERFCQEIHVQEVRCFYGFQIMMENVHAEVYSRFILELIEDPAEQQFLFKAIEQLPAVKAKADWCLYWVSQSAASLAVRVIAFAIVEGVFFSTSFAAIFWFRHRNLMPGLTSSNELIARDEGQHTTFACLLYHHLANPVARSVVYEMMGQAVQLEKAFFRAALEEPLIGMTPAMMDDYVEYVADFVLRQLGFPILYRTENPFPFMERSSIDAKTNFFERFVSDYVGANVTPI